MVRLDRLVKVSEPERAQFPGKVEGDRHRLVERSAGHRGEDLVCLPEQALPGKVRDGQLFRVLVGSDVMELEGLGAVGDDPFSGEGLDDGRPWSLRLRIGANGLTGATGVQSARSAATQA